MDIKNATGFDQIPAKVIVTSAHILFIPLTHIIIESFQSSLFIDTLKIAKVIPLHKKGITTDCTNDRPISIFPALSKIVEKIMNCQLTNFLESENILNPQRYGFKNNKSTLHAMARFTGSVLEALNDGYSVLEMLLNFSKAFDTIDHSILIDKLKSLNFSNTSVTLISNYLSNRKQLIL